MSTKPDRFISVKELAGMLGLTVRDVARGQRGTNELARIKLGSRVIFSRKAVEKWIEQRSKTDESTIEEDDHQSRKEEAS